jgi:hypothetical protein
MSVTVAGTVIRTKEQIMSAAEAGPEPHAAQTSPA